MSRSNQPIEVEAELVFENTDAFLVKVEEDTFAKPAENIWLPKSLAVDNKDGTFTVPEWFAYKKGLM